jgi:glutaredoxin
LEISVLNSSNAFALGHECDHPGERISSAMQHMPKNSNRFISDEERETIDLVAQFSKEKGLDYEVVDLNKAGRIMQLKFITKRWKTPLISIGNKTIFGLPTREELESLL